MPFLATLQLYNFPYSIRQCWQLMTKCHGENSEVLLISALYLWVGGYWQRQKKCLSIYSGDTRLSGYIKLSVPMAKKETNDGYSEFWRWTLSYHLYASFFLYESRNWFAKGCMSNPTEDYSHIEKYYQVLICTSIVIFFIRCTTSNYS